MGVLLASVGVFARIIQLQSRQHAAWTERALKQHTAALEIQGARGTVFDAEGRTLAVSVEGAAVGVRPKAFDRKAIPQLAKVLAVPDAEIESKLKSGTFSWVGRGVPQSRLSKLTSLNLAGVDIFPEFYRDYPQGSLARMILGQVSLGGDGIAGIELRFNSDLKAAKERISLRRDARGKMMDSLDGTELSFDALISPAVATEISESSSHLRNEGGDVKLSIDSRVQGILEEELARGMEEAQAKRAIGVIMRAETGELVALAQATKGGSKQRTKFLSADELRNPIVQDIFEPGSTFKPLVAALALDAKKVTASELVNCENGNYEVGGKIIHDAHPVPTVPFSEVLIRSSNIGIAKVGARLGKTKLKQGIERLGFGSGTGIELPGEQRGLLQPGEWGQLAIATNSFGHGISVTPLQLVRAYAALANGGRLVTPTILKRESSGPAGEQVISERTAKLVTDILVGVTEDEEGTGRKAALEGIKVSGKTGTAQKPRHGSKGYDPDAVFASFIGYVDSSNLGMVEHLVMFIGIDEPGVRPRWGGTVAAPVFKRAMERVLTHGMADS